MKNSVQASLSDPRVAVSALPSPHYADGAGDVTEALARAAAALGWSDSQSGAFGKVIPPGARVLIKPNWVLHENEGGGGMEPMVTHPELLRAVVDAALQSEAAEVLVGDAPIQTCDFAALLQFGGFGEWAAERQKKEARFAGIRDFRRTTSVVKDGVRLAEENKIPLDRFVLFDLAADSLLEPVSKGGNPFRVTCYDPRLMAKTHAPGLHQYLVAREVIDADLIINLPKLKTHKKAGVTCALKNLIGINGNKEYLPHHRVGGSQADGDCYPGSGVAKRALEYTLDKQNMAASPATGKLWSTVARNLDRALRMSGDQLGVEGSWSGNDTIWRTCLDLNRILLYGRADATLADTPQRQVLHVVDAVVAGQGDGPLAPQPLPLGLIFAGRNAAAVDYVGAYLLGYDPLRIPITREAFGNFVLPITSFTPDEVTVVGDVESGQARDVLATGTSGPILHPAGWRDAARRG